MALGHRISDRIIRTRVAVVTPHRSKRCNRPCQCPQWVVKCCSQTRALQLSYKSRRRAVPLPRRGSASVYIKDANWSSSAVDPRPTRQFNAELSLHPVKQVERNSCFQLNSAIGARRSAAPTTTARDRDHLRVSSEPQRVGRFTPVSGRMFGRRKINSAAVA